jgi:hypothetical protein
MSLTSNEWTRYNSDKVQYGIGVIIMASYMVAIVNSQVREFVAEG